MSPQLLAQNPQHEEKKSMSFRYEMETRVCGIPCIVKYSILGQDRPGTREEPPEYQEVEYQVCDLNGWYAPWLEDKMQHDDVVKLEQECFADAAYEPEPDYYLEVYDNE